MSDSSVVKECLMERRGSEVQEVEPCRVVNKIGEGTMAFTCSGVGRQQLVVGKGQCYYPGFSRGTELIEGNISF